jgi:uncharacterized membrane protein
MATVAATHPSLGLRDESVVSAVRLRVEAVDVVRGIAMILMALDHTRDFLGITSVMPTDLANTTVFLFFTRWITHFCAPIFFLLTGTSAYLSLQRKSKRELSRYLFTRGLWLIFLELTLFRCLGFTFNFDYHVTVLNVLWALGWAMIVLAALIHMPLSAIATFGILVIAGHNALDSIHSSNPLWAILHAPNFVLRMPQHVIFAVYPLIPWVGVTAVGYSLGALYDWTPQRRRTFLLWCGCVLTATFIVLRATDLYGDPSPWTSQKSTLFTALSFLNTTKYPPSLLFLLMTLGPALMLLAAVDHRTIPLLRPAAILGKVPMFYFLLHIPLIHLMAVVVCYARYGQTHWMFESPSIGQFPVTFPPGWGFSLPIVYLLWICVVCFLYPLCHRFATVKERSRLPWLSYV